SPAAAPSPTAASTACSSPVAKGRGGGSASSTRRWSTRAVSATCSPSAPPDGRSRTSPTTRCSCPQPPAWPADCPSGGATPPAALGRGIDALLHALGRVSPAPGVRGRLPCWKGDTRGRPAELGEAVGAFTRELSAMPDDQARARAAAEGLDDNAATNLVTYL